MCFKSVFEIVNEQAQAYHVQNQPVKTGDFVEILTSMMT